MEDEDPKDNEVRYGVRKSEMEQIQKLVNEITPPCVPYNMDMNIIKDNVIELMTINIHAIKILLSNYT